MYCGDVQGSLTGEDPLRTLGWVRRLSKRWEGCHCHVRHNQEFCLDCYESKESHQNCIGMETLSYNLGGYSYRVSLRDYERWIRPLYENQDTHVLLKQIGEFFKQTNKNVCEIWFVEGDN